MDVLLAALFALLAGAGTAVSPCVLPVLPLALPSAATGGRRRPAGIALGLGASFAFATLALAYVIDALGLPDDLLRTVAVVALLGFGIALVLPPVSARLEAWLSRLTPQRAARRGGDGFGSGVALGASLGLLYVPCAGPVLAAVLTVQASQELTAQRLVVGLAYAVGTAGAVFVVLTAGRRLLGRLRASTGRLQQALGLLMVAVAVLTLSGADGRFRTAIADDLPGWLVNPTSGIEDSRAASRALHTRQDTQGSGLPDAGPAPEIAGTQKWFNTPGGRPLTLNGLRGRVVLIDFWTYTCINCLRTLPYVKAWDARYRRDGLTVIGVHTPEFPFERDAGNVARAVEEDGIRYPVAQDNRYTVWNAFQNQYWPAKYLIDARGHVRYAHFGEGGYGRTERAIERLLREAGRDAAPRSARRVRAITPDAGVTTRETYLGAERADGWVQDPIAPGGRDFGALAAAIPQDAFAYGGVWTIDGTSAEAIHAARIGVTFRARRVYLVLGGAHTDVEVRLDGRPIAARDAGADVHDGVVRVRGQRLYRLVDLPRAGSHRLELRVGHGVRGYAFTFG
jgi:cytochrome c biogenesis protein CcdA/thiol-disulfide isomerase/thioredoxin